MAKIRAVVLEGDRERGYKRVQVLFGINYFLEIDEHDGKVSFLLGAHHEAFKADASETQGRVGKVHSGNHGKTSRKRVQGSVNDCA